MNFYLLYNFISSLINYIRITCSHILNYIKNPSTQNCKPLLEAKNFKAFLKHDDYDKVTSSKSVFKRVLEKTTENRLGRQARLGIERGISRLPVLSAELLCYCWDRYVIFNKNSKIFNERFRFVILLLFVR